VKTLAMMEGNPHFVRMLGAYESSSVLVSRKIPEDENDHFAKWRTGHQIQSSMHVIKMEICSNGDLFNVISSHGPLLEDSLLRFVFLQVCKGVHAMHSKAGHAHVDLKLENVLVGNDALIKLCDFGMA
jgi:serine/threonine protein kinase